MAIEIGLSQVAFLWALDCASSNQAVADDAGADRAVGAGMDLGWV